MSFVIKDSDSIELARLITMDIALGLEIKGLRRSRSPSAYSSIKTELNLKGNRQKVRDQLKIIIKERKIAVFGNTIS